MYNPPYPAEPSGSGIGVPGWLKDYGPMVIGAGLGWLGSRSSNAASAREAEKNRDFQERMSSTSHQRDVRDLRMAGLNPILSAHGGASTPGGSQAPVRDVSEGSGRGLASALAIKQMQANIGLTDAQAAESRGRAADLNTQAHSGRYVEIASRAEMARMSADQLRDLIPIALERAKEELRLTSANARGSELRGDLDQLLKDGSAKNVADFEKRMGELTPGMRFLLDLVRVYNGVSGEPIRRVP